MTGLKAVFVLAMKDIRLLLRDKAGFFFTFFWPLTMAIFFGVIFSGGASDKPAKIAIAVVDEDASAPSRAFADLLRGAPEFEVQDFATREESENAVRQGKRVASVAIAKGYGEASERMFFGDPARLEVVVDPSRGPEAAMLQGLLQRYGYERLQGLFGGDPELTRRMARNALAALDSGEGASPATRSVLEPFLKSLDDLAQRLPTLPPAPAGEGAKGGGFQPLVIDSRSIQRAGASGPTNSFEVSFPQGVLWGLIGACASFGLSMVVERTRGTLVRLRMSPLGRARILAGKAVACFLLTAGVSTVLLLIGAIGFAVRPTSVTLLALAVFCSCVAFVGLMMLVSTLGRTEAAASGVAWAVLLIFAMIGGGMVPRFVMPPWMQQAGVISPASWTIRALEGALWRGSGFAEMAPVLGVLLAIGVACFALGVRLFRWED
jgi:ABC-2 type transport system permease protein